MLYILSNPKVTIIKRNICFMAQLMLYILSNPKVTIINWAMFLFTPLCSAVGFWEGDKLATSGQTWLRWNPHWHPRRNTKAADSVAAAQLPSLTQLNWMAQRQPRDGQLTFELAVNSRCAGSSSLWAGMAKNKMDIRRRIYIIAKQASVSSSSASFLTNL